MVLALVSFLTLADCLGTARWLTEKQQLIIDRLRAECIGTTEVLDMMSTAKILRGILNPVVLATA